MKWLAHIQKRHTSLSKSSQSCVLWIIIYFLSLFFFFYFPSLLSITFSSLLPFLYSYHLFPFFLCFLLISSFANMPLFNNHQEAKFTSYAIKIYEVRGLVWWQDVRFQKINLKLTWQDCDWTFEHCVEF